MSFSYFLNFIIQVEIIINVCVLSFIWIVIKKLAKSIKTFWMSRAMVQRSIFALADNDFLLLDKILYCSINRTYFPVNELEKRICRSLCNEGFLRKKKKGYELI